MKKIAISSSLKFKSLVKKVINDGEKYGLEFIFPNLDLKLGKEGLILELMKRIENDHFYAIDQSEALYVIDPDGYIGNLVKVEIGYAKGRNKPVIFSEKTGEIDLDCLCNKVIPINQLKDFLKL